MIRFFDTGGDAISLLSPTKGAIHFGRLHVGTGASGEHHYPVFIRTAKGKRTETMIIDARELRQWCRAVLAALPAEPHAAAPSDCDDGSPRADDDCSG